MTIASLASYTVFCTDCTSLVGEKRTKTPAWVDLNHEVNKKLVFTSDIFREKPPCDHIFERDEKKYVNEEERSLWRSRIAMIETALTTVQLFSISIIPTNSKERQSWYYNRAVFYERPQTDYIPLVLIPEIAPATEEYELCNQMAVDSESRISRLLKNVQRDTLDQLPRYGSSKTTEHRTSEEESPDSPAPILKGFFTPFPHFSSAEVHPQYNPENLSPSVIRVDVSDEENLQRTIEDLEDDARMNVREIVDAFIDDRHSKSIALTVLEPRQQQIKTFFFRKCFNHSSKG